MIGPETGKQVTTLIATADEVMSETATRAAARPLALEFARHQQDSHRFYLTDQLPA